MRVSESTYDIAGRRLLLRVPEEADAEIMIEGLRTVCGEIGRASCRERV